MHAADQVGHTLKASFPPTTEIRSLKVVLRQAFCVLAPWKSPQETVWSEMLPKLPVPTLKALEREFVSCCLKFPGSVQEDWSQEASCSKPVAQPLSWLQRVEQGMFIIFPLTFPFAYDTLEHKHPCKAELELHALI